MFHQSSWVAGLALFIAAVNVAEMIAQEPEPSVRPYDGIQAGLDAFRLGEERRQIAVGQQLYQSDRMRAWAVPLATYGYGYGGGDSGGFGFSGGLVPASLDYAYAHGHESAAFYRRGHWYRPLTVFEPWPYVPLDIYGDVYLAPLRQPVAQVQTQTGDSRWESHPVYDPPLTPYLPQPPVNSRALDNTPYRSERPAPEPGILTPSNLPRATVPALPAPGPDSDLSPGIPRPKRRVF